MNAPRDGGSIAHNPPNAQIHISQHGTDWLWAVFAVMVFRKVNLVPSDLVFIAWSFTRPKGQRVFHQLPVVILTVASIAYFSMASDLGATPIVAEWSRLGGGTRQIWYVRYIQWFINAPLLLLEVLLTSGLSLSDIATAVFMVTVTVVCGLVGALVESTYKWGYFTMGATALLYVITVFLVIAPRTTFAAGSRVRTTYIYSAGWLSLIFILYPICWGLSEGGNKIKPTSEMVFYGILDLMAGPFFLAAFLFGLSGVDYAAFGLESGRLTDYRRFSSENGHRTEKTTQPAPVASA
ncbi:hypothetical protein JAAARDRAFT_48226 [Jaapia argillacea MUCL 33604]|uniref:Heat shock protein 30 n=1 Tax=Jaapia argillacea MUCL 33604 TaxID=933084 RepID=A0A067PND9_9AGAM|nr:hypothetical protein JAAARDRAFT_48226 [Jaapia argillacea MUCL 33604]